MKNLPAPVYDSQIEDMWNIADTDRDGRLSYQEFCVSLTPPENNRIFNLLLLDYDQPSRPAGETKIYHLNHVKQTFLKKRQNVL